MLHMYTHIIQCIYNVSHTYNDNAQRMFILLLSYTYLHSFPYVLAIFYIYNNLQQLF